MIVTEKTEGFGRLVIDVECDVLPLERTDEAVAFSGFDEMIAVVDHVAMHGREQNTGMIVLCDEAIGCFNKWRVDVLTRVHSPCRFRHDLTIGLDYC